MTGGETPIGGARLALGSGAILAAVVAAVAIPGGDVWAAALSVVGLVALAGAVRSVVRRYRDGVDAATTGDVETGVTTPTPGAGFTRALGTFEDEGAAYLAYPDRVRAALENAAVAVLGRYRGIPPEVARDRLEDGTWTDDRRAVAFLSGDERPGSGGIAGRVRSGVRGESAFRRGIRHTVAAVASVSGTDVGGARAMTGDPGTESAPTDPVPIGGTPPEDVVRTTGRWTGIAAGALTCVGVGLLANSPAVVLAGTVGVGVAAYTRGVRTPDPTLTVERSVAETDPAPGDRVAVTLTVRNDGDRVIPDLRVVEGVPPALPVAAGSVRTATTLSPGDTVTLRYELGARRGVFEFEPVTALARDPAGTVECERRIPAEGGEGAAAVTCVPPLTAGVRSVPIEGAAASYSGRVATEVGGDGIEFHSVREYQPSDSIGRVDWKRYARTRELAAREYRNERATTAVVVVDARPAAYLSPGTDHQHAVDRAVAAAGRTFAELEADGNRVGIATLGREECWLSPSTGAGHRARARNLLATHPSLSPVPPESGGDRDWVAWLRSRLPADAQVVFVSPVCDDAAAGVVRRLRAHGYPVTAVSPDPTATDTPSRALARVGRRLRLARLRDAGATVVDWRGDEPLAGALGRAADR